MFRVLCFLMALTLLCSGVGSAKQATLSPSASARVVNPADDQDVMTLYAFSVPDSIAGMDVVLAVLRVPSHGTEEVPLAVAPMVQSWNPNESWSDLMGKVETIGDSESAGSWIWTSNDIESSGQGVKDNGIEVLITDFVRPWVSGGTNYGVCVRRVPGRADGLANVLTENLPPPELIVLYTAR